MNKTDAQEPKKCKGKRSFQRNLLVRLRKPQHASSCPHPHSSRSLINPSPFK